MVVVAELRFRSCHYERLCLARGICFFWIGKKSRSLSRARSRGSLALLRDDKSRSYDERGPEGPCFHREEARFQKRSAGFAAPALIQESLQPCAAADRYDLAGHPGRVIGGEEDGHLGNVVRHAHASQRSARYCVAPELAFGVTRGLCTFGLDQSGGQRVDADVPRTKFLRQSAGDDIHCALGGAIHRGGRRRGK